MSSKETEDEHADAEDDDWQRVSQSDQQADGGHDAAQQYYQRVTEPFGEMSPYDRTD
jgi:hypothetical protein